MGIDINKIIQESVQNTIDKSKESESVETLEENKSTESKTSETKTDQETETLEESKSTESLTESFDPATASAISAGLGALTFRNHVRAIKESKSK